MNFIEQANRNEDLNAKAVLTYEIEDNSANICPYCNGSFTSNDIKCPSCGAQISRNGGKIVIKKITEHQEVLAALHYKHNERIEELKLELERVREDRKKKNNENLLTVVGAIIALIAFLAFGIRIIGK